MLLDDGPVLFQVSGDLLDVLQVDPYSSDDEGRSWAVIVKDLNDDPLFIKEGVINIQGPVFDLVQ